MRLYLAGTNGLKAHYLNGNIVPEEFHCLESYYSMNNWFIPFIPRFKSFLLDSGAFTFISKDPGKVDWLSYVDKYGDFVKENKIRLYFELDIDAVVGLKYVEMLRDRLEARVGWQSIPVWHVSRGREYFEQMCRAYPYVAFGGIITDGLTTRTLERYFPWFIKTAHEKGAKLHGLGYTNISGMKRYHFDSIDSTTWTAGQRFGQIMEYKDGRIIKHNSVQGGVKTRSIKDPRAVSLHNFKEWVKLSKYAEIYY